ncbi:hypothetical protein [Rhodocyclus tenuis]|uniref:Uncharacterized protein n=1 Tax=Rhodocyclus tenuis TaxID=1066 RepID=A0A840GB64_RHOTE|nr:hypothetical protein [Rhodocyclus tenuis]MBB4248130.1 hypothetical protein [Rhodocyclus tenuis]MBK1679380.1 hypothetical protein [Rhodocyclus tenuis]
MTIANLFSSRLRQLLFTQVLRLLARMLPLLVAALRRSAGGAQLRPLNAAAARTAASQSAGRVFDGEYRREDSGASANGSWPRH